MYERFGEFDSAEELNRCAHAQFLQGEDDVIRALGKENGLDEDDIEAYIAGDEEELTCVRLAAVGKLNVEILNIGMDVPDIMADWVEYIKAYCFREDAFAAAYRRKGKSLRGCIAELMRWSLKNAKEVPKEICKDCGITYKVTLGIPGAKKAKELIRAYYLGEEKA